MEAKRFQEFAKCLPRALTRLSLQFHRLCFDWPSALVAPTQHTPDLKYLGIGVLSGDELDDLPVIGADCGQSALNFLTTLPPSLTALTIPVSRFWETHTSIFKKLPRGLSKLTMKHRMLVGSDSGFTAFTDEHFTAMPASLTKLEIPSDKRITNRFWEVIPKTIRTVSFATVTQRRQLNEAREWYYINPIWQGTADN